MMILTEEVMKQSPDTRLVAIHNHKQDGTYSYMNFELSNGYVTKQTGLVGIPTAHRHVIPGAVFTHTTQVLVHYDDDCIHGFRFLDAQGNELWKHGYIIGYSVQTVKIPNTHRFVGFRATP